MSSSIQLGDFLLEEPIARGGMGQVWRARHVSGVPAAIKVLTHDGPHRRAGLEGLQAEIRAVAGLDHPHIVWIHDAGQISDTESDRSGGRLPREGPWFAMEYADGGTLRDRPPLNWEETSSWLGALLRALAHAHANGVVHRDLKPANILFDGDTPKLSDFGMVLNTDPTDPERLPGGGTPAYMAPEQFEGARWDLGPWTDLYSLGCVAYALVVGRRPYPGKGWVRLFNAHWNAPIPDVVPRFDIPDGFEDWLHALMAKNRHHRFQRAADALHALQTLRDTGTQTALTRPLNTPAMRPIYPRPPLPHYRRRYPAQRENLAVGLGLYGLRTLPFVGRDQERGRLWELMASVIRHRTPRAVVLRGPSGVGKSRLAEWMMGRTHEVGAGATFRATHSPLPAALDGLNGLLSRALRVWDADRETLQAAIEDEMGPRGFKDPGEQKVLVSLLAPDEQSPTLAGRRRHALLARALAALSNERPAVLWLDDVQWGLDALDFADHLLTANDAPPCLLVLTCRDDALEHEPETAAALDDLLEHTNAEAITLAPLARTASVELIERGLGLRPKLARQLHERIQGNPMFAVELVGDWVERGLLVPAKDGFALAGTTRLRAPASVSAVWQGRIAQLTTTHPDARTPMDLAAALGLRVDPEEWKLSCKAAHVQPPADFWERLEDLRLVRRDSESGHFDFAHGQLRDLILASADGLDHLHRSIASVVDDEGRRGMHLLQAGDLAAGTAALFDGAQRAANTDMRKGLRLLMLRDDALEQADPHHPDRIAGHLLSSRIARAGARPKEGLAWAETALELAQHHDDAVSVVAALQCAASSARMLGRIEHARTVSEQALHLSTGLPPQTRAETLFQVAAVLTDMGELSRAERFVRQALPLRHSSHRRIRTAALLSYLLSQRGAEEEAREVLEGLLPEAEASGHKASQSDLHIVLGEVERSVGNDEAAETHYRKALSILAGTGIVAPACRANLALTLLDRGQVHEARALLKRVRTEAAEIGTRMLILVAHAGLAACNADLRKWSLMEEHLDALDADPGGLAADDIARPLHYAGTHALALGKADLGRRALRIAVVQYERLGRKREANDLTSLL